MSAAHHVAILLCSSPVLGFYSYSDSYPEEEDYHYLDEEEEGVADYVPVFLTSPHTVYVAPHGHARLECRVDRLGPMVLSWSRVSGANSSYLATGRMVLAGDPRLGVEALASASTLLVREVGPGDEGEYLCEASSQPPVHIKLELRITAPPSVSILGRPPSGLISLRPGAELALVCRGSGQPPPSLSWRREAGRLPDGSLSVAADQVIFSHVSPAHAGTYTCRADRGAANASVTVRVLHPPVLQLDQSYQHRARGATLELVCTVQADPPAAVEWWRSGLSLAGLGEVGGRARVEYRDPGRHILCLDRPQQSDLGIYSCTANNTEGSARAEIDVSGPGSPPAEPEGRAPLSLVAGAAALQRGEQEEETHRLLKHIVHRIGKFDRLHRDLVTAMKESNRFLQQLLRDQKKLLAQADSAGDSGL